MSDSSAIPWTVAYQAPLSMGFSSQEYWSGLPPKDLPHPRIEPCVLHWQADSLPLSHQGSPNLRGFTYPLVAMARELQKNHSRSYTCTWSVFLSPWFITSVFRALEELKKSPEFFFNFITFSLCEQILTKSK